MSSDDDDDDDDKFSELELVKYFKYTYWYSRLQPLQFSYSSSQ